MLESRSVSRTAVPQIIDRLPSEGYHFVTESGIRAANLKRAEVAVSVR